MLSSGYLHVYSVLVGLPMLAVDARGSDNCGSGLLREYNDFPRPRTCQPFQKNFSTCSRIGNYYATRMPNFLNHGSQSEAHRQLMNFQQLIDTQCSGDLLFFLCLFHFPLCVNGLVNPVVPCKGLCERVRDSCSPVLERHNHIWPELFDCDTLPEDPGVTCDQMEPEVCVSGPPPQRVRPSEDPRRFPTSGATSVGNSQNTVPSPDQHAVLNPGVLSPQLEKCYWEHKESQCIQVCRRGSNHRRLPKKLDWAGVGKVTEVRIGNNCRTAWYTINVTHVLSGGFTVRELVHLKARMKGPCLCPLLQPDETYFFARRAAASPRTNCQQRGKKTICSMKHKDIALRLTDEWPTGSRKQFRKSLNDQGFPRWLIRVVTDLREKN